MKTIFIGGSQRSGTTLLNKFLCLDQHTNPKIAEASYLRELVSAYKNALLDFDHDSASYFENQNDLRQFHSSIINLFLNRTLKRFPGTSTLVLKEPHLTQFFPELFDLVPHARFIISVRDPRDIIASMIQVGERMQASGQQHFFQQRNMPLLCQQVLSFYAPGLNNQNPAFRKNLLIIRYEDFIQQTETVKRNLAQFSGLELDFASNTHPNQSMQGESMQDDATTVDPNHPDQKRYQPWITQNNSKEINDSSIGNYKKILTAAEIESINRQMQVFMKLFNYPV